MIIYNTSHDAELEIEVTLIGGPLDGAKVSLTRETVVCEYPSEKDGVPGSHLYSRFHNFNSLEFIYDGFRPEATK